MANEPLTWDLWVDFACIDADGLTRAHVRDAAPGVQVEVDRYLVVGDEDADPAVAHVVALQPDGVVLLRVLPGHANAHLDLLSPRPSTRTT